MWRPTSAISSARRASDWPRTSARSGPGRGSGRWTAAVGRAGASGLVPARWPITARSVAAAWTAMPVTAVASGTVAGATTTDRATSASRRGDQRQHAGHRPQPAVERKLPQQRRSRQPVERRQLARGGEDPDRDRQVVAGAVLRQVGRSKVHGDAARGDLEPAVAQRAADPFARLLHGVPREADDGEAREAEGDVDLDARRGKCLDPQDRGAGDRRASTRQPPSRRRRWGRVPVAHLLASQTPAATGRAEARGRAVIGGLAAAYRRWPTAFRRGRATASAANSDRWRARKVIHARAQRRIRAGST